MSSQPSRPVTNEIEDAGAGWSAMLQEWSRFQWRRLHHGVEPGGWPPPWAIPALSIAGLVLAVAVIAGLIVPLLAAIARFLVAAVDGGADWVRDWNLARLVLDPVRAYLDTHATGLPIGADTLWWTWTAAGAAFFLLGWLAAAVAARIGWVLWGAATVAMVYATTTGPARTTTAGIAVLWWTVLSLFALRRRVTTQRVHLPELPLLTRVLDRRTP